MKRNTVADLKDSWASVSSNKYHESTRDSLMLQLGGLLPQGAS